MNPADKNNQNRAMQYKKLVMRLQQIREQISEITSQANDLRGWTTAFLDHEVYAVASLDNARAMIDEAADHFQHSANMYSGGSQYHLSRSIAGPAPNQNAPNAPEKEDAITQ